MITNADISQINLVTLLKPNEPGHRIGESHRHYNPFGNIKYIKQFVLGILLCSIIAYTLLQRSLNIGSRPPHYSGTYKVINATLRSEGHNNFNKIPNFV
jgi:hypothetical protein